jgi:hypothetical protein
MARCRPRPSRPDDPDRRDRHLPSPKGNPHARATPPSLLSRHPAVRGWGASRLWVVVGLDWHREQHNTDYPPQRCTVRRHRRSGSTVRQDPRVPYSGRNHRRHPERSALAADRNSTTIGGTTVWSTVRSTIRSTRRWAGRCVQRSGRPGRPEGLRDHASDRPAVRPTVRPVTSRRRGACITWQSPRFTAPRSRGARRLPDTRPAG